MSTTDERDPHLVVVANALEVTYERAKQLYDQDNPEVCMMRNRVKSYLNFGVPLGMGVRRACS